MKLDPVKVEQIRIAAAGGARLKALSQQYGVSPVAISYIIHGRLWPHAPGPILPRTRRHRHKGSMTDHQIVLARLRAERGESVKDLAASMGADQSTLGQYLTGKLGKKLPGPRTRRREKLKEADVVDIRWAWYYRHNSRAELADMYQVSLSAIKAATTGESWKHAGGPVTKPNTKRGQ